jgi:hypothetical protein
MAKTVIALEATMNASGAEGSVKSLKAQLREAQAEVQKISEEFGNTSSEAANAAMKAAELKAEIRESAKLTEAFNPDKKLAAFGSALRGVVGGFEAVKGAQALFGTQSEELEKTLTKVQGALALSQSISDLEEGYKSFKNLGTVIRTNVVTSLTTLRGALIATGIGALAIGVGLLVANFDAVKEAVLKFIPGLKSVTDFVGKLINKITDFIGVTSEAKRAQESFIKDTEKQIKKTDEFLDSQGYKYDEFTQRKIKANNEYRKHEIEISKDTTKTEAEKQALLKAYRDKADYEIDQADKDRLAKQKENNKAVVKEHKDTNVKIIEETEQARKARESAEFLLLDSTIAAVDAAAQAESEAFDENFIDFTDNVIEKEDFIKKQAEDELAIEKAKYEQKKAIQEATFGVLDAGVGFLKEIAGKNKGFQKAAIITENAVGIAKQIIANQTANAGALATPQAIASGGISAAPVILRNNIRTALGIATTIAATAKALSAVGGGSAGGGGNIPGGGGGTEAPIGPQMGATALQQAQINAAGSAAVQAFVLESDVSGNQERIERLNRAARIQ